MTIENDNKKILRKGTEHDEMQETMFPWPVNLLIGIMAASGMFIFAGVGNNIITGAIVGFIVGGVIGTVCGFIIKGSIIIIPIIFRFSKYLLVRILLLITIIVIIVIIVLAFLTEFG